MSKICHDEKISNLGFTKIKNFQSAKDSVKRINAQTTDWETNFAKHMFDK